MYRGVGRTSCETDGRIRGRNVAVVFQIAGRVNTLPLVGPERLGAVTAGALAAEILQQASRVQSIGDVPSGWDLSQVMPMNMAGIALLLAAGQHSMVLWLPQVV